VFTNHVFEFFKIKNMKKILSTIAAAALFVLLTIAPQDMFAQNGSKSKSKKIQKKENPNQAFMDKLWYGINIGNIGGASGYVGVGFSPIVAYKVLPNLSVGGMWKIDYSYYNLSANRHPFIKKFETINFGPTAFARLRVFERFYAQVEYEMAYFQEPEVIGSSLVIENNKVKILKFSRPYAYAGIGYIQAQGNTWGYNISLNYNLIHDPNDFERRILDYRAGLTYNF
jgi:hypothetical protein